MPVHAGYNERTNGSAHFFDVCVRAFTGVFARPFFVACTCHFHILLALSVLSLCVIMSTISCISQLNVALYMQVFVAEMQHSVNKILLLQTIKSCNDNLKLRRIEE